MVRHACDLTALSPTERIRRAELFEAVGRHVHRVEELSNGYRVQLRRETADPAQLAELVGYERRCCPTLSFTIGDAVLDITGAGDAKRFIEAEFGFRPSAGGGA